MKTFAAMLALFLSSPGAALATDSTANDSTGVTEAFHRGSQLGFSVGTPAGINLEYSYEFGKCAVYASGMYYGSHEAYGFQAGVSLARGGTSRKYLSVNLVSGYYFYHQDPPQGDHHWAYGGFEVYLRYRWIFLAPGITFGTGDLENAASDYHGPAGIARLGLTWPI
jgi:hypothetical protein